MEYINLINFFFQIQLCAFEECFIQFLEIFFKFQFILHSTRVGTSLLLVRIWFEEQEEHGKVNNAHG